MSSSSFSLALTIGLLSVASAGCSSDKADAARASMNPSGEGGAGTGPDASPQLPRLGGDASLGTGGTHSNEAHAPCLTLALWGHGGSNPWGPPTQLDALANWFVESSTATVRSVQLQPESIEAALEGVDVLLLRDLRGWELTGEDEQSIAEWLEDGGAIMALSGYVGDGGDVRNTNALLSFSQMRFSTASDLNTALGIGACGYCLGTTSPQGGFESEHPIARGVQRVGAYQGRSIEGEGQVVAAEDGLILGMTNEIGAGRVFFFHDDWVSRADAWHSAVQVDCSDNQECAEVSIAQTYQMHQFWYNAVRWLTSAADCFEFTATDVSVERW